MDVMNQEAGTPLRILKVDGGLSNSDICMQIQSDIVGIPVGEFYSCSCYYYYYFYY